MKSVKRLINLSPRYLAFTVSSLLGLASLVLYQNCGAPEQETVSASSLQSGDFYRWMPDTLITFSCANRATRESFPSAWVFTSRAGAKTATKDYPYPSGVRLSDEARAEFAGKDPNTIVSKLPAHQLLLTSLVAESVQRKPSSEWLIENDGSYKPLAKLGYRLLNVGASPVIAQGGPGTRLALNQHEPFGRDGFYLNTPMKVASDEREGGRLPFMFSIGLLFAPKDVEDLSDEGVIVRNEFSDGRTGPAGTALVILLSGIGKGRIPNFIEVFNDQGRATTEMTKHPWTCPASDKPTSLRPDDEKVKNRLFMVFRAEDRQDNIAEYVQYPEEPTPTKPVYCKIFDDEVQQRVDLTLGIPLELKSMYKFGTLIGADQQWPCLVWQRGPAAEECYSVNSIGQKLVPDYAQVNPYESVPTDEGKLKGKVAPHWMSICTRN